jgi:hypothetical protein
VTGGFHAAVVEQVRRLGGDAERAAAEVPRLLSMPGNDSAARLAADPVLLSILFQNIDLLYDEGHPAADRVARRVMEAIHVMEASEG